MQTRLAAALFVIVLVATGCGSQAQPTGLAGPSNQPTQSQPQPTAQQTDLPTAGATTTDAPSTSGPHPTQAPLAPLPAPELRTADEVVQALLQPELSEQAVVSMLDQLGIGLYQTDGTLIRAGLEKSNADLFLYEPEARGLIDMLQSMDTDDGWISFSDFHAALAGLGFQGSASDLLAAYRDSYAANPDEPISKFVNALWFADPEAPLPRLAAWLLFVDGFVPVSGEAAIAAVAGDFPRVAAGPTGRRVAQPAVQSAALFIPLTADPVLVSHLMAMIAGTSISVHLNPSFVHEGHGAPGPPVEIKAKVQAPLITYASPFGAGALFPINGGTQEGIPVTWETDSKLARHGSVSAPPLPRTDVLGETLMTFTPRQEPANGQGKLVQTVSLIKATVSGSDILTFVYGQPALGALVPAQAFGFDLLTIEWHDAVMHLELTNPYDITIESVVGNTSTKGEDTIVGDLTVDEVDGVTWRGTLLGNAHGSWQGTAFGESCSSSWDATQELDVVGIHDIATGMIRFTFTPVGAPNGSTGSGKCPPTRHKDENGTWFAPFNDLAVTDPAIGLVFIMPPPPGLESDYPVPNPGGGIIIKNTKWHVKIDLPPPPP